MFQDFLTMTDPVGTFPNDDSILVQAIVNGVQNGKTHREAIETLHGVALLLVSCTNFGLTFTFLGEQPCHVPMERLLFR